MSSHIRMDSVKHLISSILAVISISAMAAEKPQLPYFDWGACPFECCTYQEWETTVPVIAKDKPAENGTEVFRLEANTPVTGITGVVITTETSAARVQKPTKLGFVKGGDGRMLNLKPGDVIYPLHYLGEGFWLFWHEGHFYSDELGGPYISIGTEPRTVWWVQFKDKQGRTGWTKVDRNFSHMDACE